MLSRRSIMSLCLGFLLPSLSNAFDIPPAPSAWEISCLKEPGVPLPNKAFAESETQNYSVRWGPIPAGQGTIGVLGIEKVDGRPAYHVFMEIKTTGATASIHQYNERTEAWLDKETLLTLRAVKQTRETGYSRDEAIVFDQACQRYEKSEFRPDTGAKDRKQDRLPPNTLDMLGYFFYLRTLPLSDGAHYDLTLLSGDHVWPVTVNVVRHTKISGPSGWHDTFFLEPSARISSPNTKLRQIEAWFNADEKKVPVRLRMELKIGSITAELTS